MKISKLLLVGLVTMVVNTSNAQFLERLKNGVQTSVEETVIEKSEEKAEEETEKTMDGLFGIGKNKKNKSNSEDNENNENSNEGTSQTPDSGESKPISDEYIFTFSSTIEFENFENGEGEKTTMTQTYGEGTVLTDMAANSMIYDFKSNNVILLNKEDKSAQVMSMSFMTNMLANSINEEVENEEIENGEPVEEPTMTKTGNTKTMFGYSCEEYLTTHNDGKSIIWLALDVPFSYSEFLESFGSTFGVESDAYNDEMGYIMEMTSFDKQEKKTSHMIVTEISEETITIPLNKYKVTKLM